MKTRTLGTGGLVVSAIGLGQGARPLTPATATTPSSSATMRRALEPGMTFFDTADAYSGGRHEALIGRAIQGRRHEVVIASKFGNLDLPGGTKGYYGRPDYVPRALAARPG